MNIVTDRDSSYTTTLSTVEGCDSIATLVVTINPVLTGTEPISVCYGAPAFDWNGMNIVTDRDSSYTTTLTTVEGCDSIATLVVTINPVLTGTEPLTICKGAPEFDWNGINIVTDRDSSYTTTLSTAEGCDSIATLVVTINPVLTGTEPLTICEGAPEFDWNGINIVTDRDSSYTTTLSTVEGCDSIATLVVTINPVLTGTEPLTICEGAPEFDWNGINIVTDRDSSYTTTLTTVEGCDSIATLVVTINPVLTGTEPLTICEGASEFDWHGINIVTDRDSSYTTTLSTVEGCDSIATLIVSITPPVTGTEPLAICEGAPEFDWNGINIVTDRDSSYTTTLSLLKL